MTYETLKLSIGEILNNENISKNGLIITYKLNLTNFRQIYLSFISDIGETPNDDIDDFEINVDGLIIKCIQDVEKG